MQKILLSLEFTNKCVQVYSYINLHIAHSLYLTNKTWLWGQYGSLQTGQSKLEWYMARSAADIARKYMFYLLYYTESMNWKSYLITSTIISLTSKS